jgi:7,8-dihydroneopterin aldolase/epimerase/oxygenase
MSKPDLESQKKSTKPFASTETTYLSAELQMLNLEVFVHLGVSELERLVPQPVAISVKILFDQMPEACRTDELDQTQCYGLIAEKIKNLIEPKTYHLIEHLTHAIFKELEKMVSNIGRLQVSVHKLHPPVSGLKGGSVFILTQQQEQKNPWQVPFSD